MNFVHISNRIEIRFWQLVVAVLKGQRLRLYTVLLLPMLGLSMAFITTASLSAFQDEVVAEIGDGLPGKVVHPVHHEPPLPRLLFVLVKDLNQPVPVIRGGWAALSSPHSCHTEIVPLIPQRPDLLDENSLFRLTSANRLPDGKAGLAFWRSLWESEVAWDGYLVLDDAALGSLAELAGEDAGSRSSMLAQINSADIRHSQRAQAMLLQVLCSQATQLGAQMRPGELPLLLSGHIKTSSRDLGVLLESWPMRDDAGYSACSFPTLGDAASDAAVGPSLP